MNDRPLSWWLRGSGLFLGAYFTVSHWFFPKAFFRALEETGPELDSPFLLSQLQLIGAMVLGYAALCWLVAREPARHHEVLRIILGVGALSTLIFVGSVALGRLPAVFLVNAGVLLLQMSVVAGLMKRSPSSLKSEP